MRMKNIAVMLVLGCLATSAMAGKYTVVGDLTVESNATLNTVAVQNGIVIEGDTLLQNSRLGMRNSSSNDFAFVSNVGTGNVSVLNIADTMFVGESSNVVIGTVPTNGEEKLQVVGNVKADFFIGDGSRLTNVVIGGAISAAGRGTRTAATLASIFDEAGLDGADAEVLIDGGVWNVDADLVVPENVILNIRPGSVINVASGRTFVVNGTIVDGMAQRFSGAGRVYGISQPVRPEWWGARANDSTPDSVMIQKAVNSGSLVVFVDGVYLLDREVNPTNNLTLKGSGRTVFRATDDIDNFDTRSMQYHLLSFRTGWDYTARDARALYCTNVTIQDLSFDCNLSSLAALETNCPSAGAINLRGEGIYIGNCDFHNFGPGLSCTSEENFVVTIAPMYTNATHNNTVYGSRFHDAFLPDARVGSGGGGTIIDCQGWSYPHGENAGVTNNFWKWSQKVSVTAAKGVVRNCSFYNIDNRTEIDGVAKNIVSFYKCIGGNIIENNTMTACQFVDPIGVMDTGNFDPLIVRDNTFLNATCFLATSYQTYSAKFRNVNIDGNYVSIYPKDYISPIYFCTWMQEWSRDTYETFTNAEYYPIMEQVNICNNYFVQSQESIDDGVVLSKDYLSGINFWLNTNMVFEKDNQLFRSFSIMNNVMPGEVRFCSFYNDEQLLDDYVMDGLHCSNNRRLDSYDEPTVFFGSSANGYGTKRFPVTAAVFSASELAEIQSFESLFGSDGGMGSIDIVRPITAYGRVEYSKETNIVFSGRQALKITVTNSEHGTVTARLHSSNHIISPARDVAYTLGAWFYPLATNQTIQVGYLANTTFADGYSYAYTHVVEAKDTGKWINVSCTIRPITTNINTVDLYFGFLPSSYPEVGAVVYIDDVYLVRGMLPKNQAAHVGELYSGENATHLTPLFIGEDVYNATDGKWYKAKGLTTNDWVQL